MLKILKVHLFPHQEKHKQKAIKVSRLPSSRKYIFSFRPWLLSDLSFYGVMVQVCADLGVWISMLLIIVAAIIPDILVRASRDIFSPAYNYRAQKQVCIQLRSFLWCFAAL